MQTITCLAQKFQPMCNESCGRHNESVGPYIYTYTHSFIQTHIRIYIHWTFSLRIWQLQKIHNIQTPDPLVRKNVLQQCWGMCRPGRKRRSWSNIVVSVILWQAGTVLP